MFCRYCGNEIKDNDAFCSKCGKSQSDDKANKISKEKYQSTKIKKVARLINILFFAFAYLVSFVTFIYIAVEDGGISPAVLPAIIIFIITLLLNLFVFRKKQISAVKSKFKNNKKVSNIIIAAIYIILPLALFFGSFEYSYYVTIGNSQAVATRYVKRTLKSNLKNPESLQIHNITYKGEEGLEDDDYRYFNVTIEYSAQNGFGGYTRDTLEKHLQVSKSTANVIEISAKDYKDKIIEYRDKENKKLYSEGLSSLSDDIPFGLICDRNMSYDSVVNYFNGKDDFELDTFNYNAGKNEGAIELTTEVSYCKLDGQLTFFFEQGKNNLRRIEFLWSPNVVFYDEEEGSKTIGEGQTADNKKIEEIAQEISDKLKIDYEDLSMKNQSIYKKSYVWTLGNNIKLSLEWSYVTDDEKKDTSAVSPICLKVIND